MKGARRMSKDLEMSYLLDFYGDVLTEKQRDVMEQYYNDDLSLSEIADNAGITRQGVRDGIKRAEHILLDLEDKIGWAARYRELAAGLEAIEEQTRVIQEHHEQGHILGTGVYDATVSILATLKKIRQ